MAIKPREMICCCCGSYTKGRQWWNRDKGFGLCSKCADWIAERETPEEMARNYGQRGEHYDIKEDVCIQ